MDNRLELFLHDRPESTPVLLRAALAHVQLETIHPLEASVARPHFTTCCGKEATQKSE